MDGFALPVKKLKGTDPVEMLDLLRASIGVASAVVIASLIGDNGALTSVDVGWNDINGNVAQELATVVLSKPTLEDFCNIPIKKLRADSLSELDLSGNGVGVPGALVLANLLPVTGGLTSIDLSRNQLCGIWTDWEGDQHGTYTAEGITLIADALRVNGALTSVDLGGNKLGDEGWGAIFAAICGNKDSKIMCLDASSENISPAGVKLIAEALRTSVTGALMKVR